METTRRLIDHYLPPGEGFVLESLIATTYQIDFEFLEEELFAAALGVRSPLSRLRAFRTELERKLQKTEISVLYDPRGCEKLTRFSPRIDAIPISARKLHSKISLLMWSREDSGDDNAPERRMRLLIGSANLTRSGFRENYECVASIDFGGRTSAPSFLLIKAIELVEQIAVGLHIPQLSRQFASFSKQGSLLGAGRGAPEEPVAVVTAEEVLPELGRAWSAVSAYAPERVTVVSPFWPEGATAPDALSVLVQKIGSPASLDLVCRGERSPDGKNWLPVFDGEIAVALRKRIAGRLFLRAARPDFGFEPQDSPTVETGDELEDDQLAAAVGGSARNHSALQRALHAKMVMMDGTAGSVLYIGSANCTRRGLGLGGQTNFEAGIIYRLTARQRRQVTSLFEFAGPPTEVVPNCPPITVQPNTTEELAFPGFLSEVVALGNVLTIRLRGQVPNDLVLLMLVSARADDAQYWLLYRAEGAQQPAQTIVVNLGACPRCDEQLTPLPADAVDLMNRPNVVVEVRWENYKATFPVRFDDKAQLPLILSGRKPTEAELIDYFRLGREPDEWNDVTGALGDSGRQVADAPIDTRRILAYLIRRFVEAIPGIEAELRRAAYSRASLDSALRGPTSPLALAERAFSSLFQPPANDEPQKTPTAVGFQITEILASLLRSQATTGDPEMRVCFDSVLVRCRELLNTLIAQFPELQTKSFRLFKTSILGGQQ